MVYPGFIGLLCMFLIDQWIVTLMLPRQITQELPTNTSIARDISQELVSPEIVATTPSFFSWIEQVSPHFRMKKNQVRWIDFQHLNISQLKVVLRLKSNQSLAAKCISEVRREPPDACRWLVGKELCPSAGESPKQPWRFTGANMIKLINWGFSLANQVLLRVKRIQCL